MAETTKQPRTRRRMKIGRVWIGLSVVVQIVAILFLAVVVNSFAFKYYKRWDFSRDQKYALSDKTMRFLDTLKGKMRITVFFFTEHADHGGRSEFADRIPVRRKRKDRRRAN